MSCSALKKIISGNRKEANEGLRIFIEINSKVFTFKDLHKDNDRKELWKVLFNYIGDNEADQLRLLSLSAVRILSRDKTDLDQLVTESRLDFLLECAHLKNDEKSIDYHLVLEALKCLCNIIYNSPVAAAICSKNACVQGIMDRARTYKDSRIPTDIKIFDMKILFLITALCNEIRPKLREELHGLTYLIDFLELKVDNCDKKHNGDDSLSDSDVDLICEILKVLFNLTISPSNQSEDEEEEARYVQWVKILRRLLVINTQNSNKKMELHNHIINLLTNMSNKSCLYLKFPIGENEHVPKNMQFEEENMKGIYEILLFLKNRLAENLTVKTQQELLSPVLMVLLKAVSSSRAIRKYLRIQILPPLRDVHHRPEHGNTLRNCLCRLLTTPITHIRDLTADLLFILCKENVGRMVKYTGYGNAAGLFAQRGLLGNGRPSESHYSSDSDDSDTEEYRDHKHGINPVIGCYETPHPSATAHMTEEQKEYEAMKLVELMDNLTRRGIVQPCRIGEDGRPEPIEHVLQLQEDLPNQQVHNINDNDD